MQKSNEVLNLIFINAKFKDVFTFGIYIDKNNRIRYRWVCNICQKMFDCGIVSLISVFEEVRKHYFNYQIGNKEKHKLKGQQMSF